MIKLYFGFKVVGIIVSIVFTVLGVLGFLIWYLWISVSIKNRNKKAGK